RCHAAGQEHVGALAGLTLTLTRCFHGGKLLEARSSNRPPGTKSSASAKYSLHASDQLVWSRVLDPTVRVRNPDPQSSVSLSWIRLSGSEILGPTKQYGPSLESGCPAQKPGPTKQCGASLEPGCQTPGPTSSVEPGLGPGCPGQRPGPTKQCGASLGPGCPGQRPGPTKQCEPGLGPGCPAERPAPTKQCGASLESSC